jgi:predicted transglutaminase-like cysteine proteinase
MSHCCNRRAKCKLHATDPFRFFKTPSSINIYPLNPLRKFRRITLAVVFSGMILISPATLPLADFNLSKLTESARPYGPQAVKDVENMTLLISHLESVDEKEKIKQVNEFFNQHIRYFDDDINIWGKSDYWATPIESLGKQRGDCEDFSIAKYLVLKQFIPDDKLRLTYVRAQIGGPHSKIFLAHMVLIYYETPTAEPLILDNLISEIRPASRRKDLRPIFGFNSEGLWLGSDKEDKGNSVAHLSRWREVLKRAKDEGIE